MILGVCSWLGNKFGINPTIIRVLFVASAVLYGAGLFVYLILWVVKTIQSK